MYEVEIIIPAKPGCHYFIPTNDPMHVYDLILDLTDNHQLSADISGWAELADLGETYEDDGIFAEIVKYN